MGFNSGFKGLNISWLVGRYKSHVIRGQWTKEQVRQIHVTFALIVIMNKGLERYIYTYTYIFYDLIKRNNFPLKYLQFYWLQYTFRRWRYCVLYGYLNAACHFETLYFLLVFGTLKCTEWKRNILKKYLLCNFNP